MLSAYEVINLRKQIEEAGDRDDRDAECADIKRRYGSSLSDDDKYYLEKGV